MTIPLWTSDDLEAATGGKATEAFTGNGVSIDTRTLQKDDIFVAIMGVAQDGHAYVEEAFRKGASAAIVRKGYRLGDDIDGKLLHVEETLTALEDMGRAARARTQATIIGVTGSVGKTGTKEILASILPNSYASRKSFNNHWGVPLSLANMPPDVLYSVFELGMNHSGEIKDLVAMVKPHVALITTIEPVHIENFKNLEGIADAKAEIFMAMDGGGTAILPQDNAHFLRLKRHAESNGVQRILSFGEDDAADARMVDCTLRGDSSKTTAQISKKDIAFTVSIPGHHHAMNALAALLVAEVVGGDLKDAVRALKHLNPVEGRGNRIAVHLDDGSFEIIDESYNANPASMTAAFSILNMAEPAQGGRRIAVLGDMLELGARGPEMHAELANPLLQARADLIFCCGPLMEALYDVLPADWRGGHAADSQSLAPMVTQAVRPGDIVLVKGSAGSKMGYIVHALEGAHIRKIRHAL